MMKKTSLLLLILLVSLSAIAQVENYVPAKPNPPRLVNDLSATKLLTPEQVDFLETKLVKYDDSTSTQIAVVVVDDLHGYSAVEFAVALGRKWGIGGSQFNNGIVILVSTGGQAGDRDAFIATGYGLEGAIPDATANTILNAELIPYLKSGEYYAGFNRTTEALMEAARGEYTAPEGYRKGREGRGSGKGGFVIIIIIIFIILSLFGGNNRGGGYVSRRGSRGFFGPTIFPTGGFGSSGGGGWSGGGGFGGFGGGSFGGGGAGGKW